MGRVRRGRKHRIRTLDKDDLDSLRKLLVIKGTKWQDWECRLHSGNIIIYSPAPSLSYEVGKLDPSKRRVEKRFRVVPEPGGPCRLEHMRLKGRWCPIDDALGDLEAITEFIRTDTLESSHADATQLRLKFHPRAG